MDANDAKVPEIGLRPRAIEFAGPSHTIEVINTSDREAEVLVKLQGNSAFGILKKHQEVTIKPGRSAQGSDPIRNPQGRRSPDDAQGPLSRGSSVLDSG